MDEIVFLNDSVDSASWYNVTFVISSNNALFASKIINMLFVKYNIP